MADRNQQNDLSDPFNSEMRLNQGCFAQFAEDERCVLGEALRELLQVKQEAMEIANTDLGRDSDPKSHFSERDFGIPAIERMMDELEESP